MKIGSYAVESVSASGGTSRVWRGRHPQGEQVAIKVLRADVSRDVSLRRALVREVRALARLDHPGVVPIYDHGVVTSDEAIASGGDLPAGSPWIAMPWISDVDLRRHRPEDLASFHGLARRLLEALAHAHARGLLHRDVKLANVLWRAGALPVLTDFGIAALADEVEEASVASAGTLGFAAPEQLDGDRSAMGPWTDLFGVGSTLRHLLPTAAVPDELERWLSHLTAFEPFDRPASVAAALASSSFPEARGVRPAGRRVTPASLPLLALRPPPVVGLEGPRQRLMDAWQHARGRPTFVRISGRPGSGRSTLSRWIVERAVEEGAIAVELRASDGRDVATGALARLLRADPPAAASEVWRPLLGEALWAGLVAPTCRVLVGVLHRLGTRWPVVVRVEPSADAVGVLREIRRFGTPSLVLVAPDSWGPAVDVGLEPPSLADLAQIVEAHVPLDRPDSLAIASGARQDANLAISQLWARVQAGEVLWRDGGWCLVGGPRRIDHAGIRAPLHECVLGALAPWLRPHHMDLAVQVCGAAMERAFDGGYASWERHRLVLERIHPRHAWPTGTDEACVELGAELSEDPQLQAALGDHLDALGRHDEAVESWFHACGRLNRDARHDAVLPVARRLIERLPEADSRSVRARYLEAVALGHVGAVTAAITACEALLAWGEANGDVEARALGGTERVLWLQRAGRPEALAAAREAVALARGTNMEASSWLYLLHTLPMDAAEEAARAEAAGLRASTRRTRIHHDLAFSGAIRLRARGRDDEAAARCRAIAADPEAEVSQRARARSMLGEIARSAGALAEAEQHLRTAAVELGRDGDPATYVLIRVNLSMVMLDRGDPLAAREVLLPLLEHYDPAATSVEGVVELVLATLAAVAGDPVEAGARLEVVERWRARRILHQRDSLDLLDRFVAHTDGHLRERAASLRAELAGHLGVSEGSET